MTLCRSCRQANVSCPVYPLDTQTCAEYAPKEEVGMSDVEHTQGSIITVLQAGGVFKGAHGLEGLLNAETFWAEKPYGTRIYYGEGIDEYLHRDVLSSAVKALARLADTERQLREAQERCELLEVALDAAAIALRDAGGYIADWGAYVSECFQKKHGLEGDIESVNAACRAAFAALAPEPDEMTQAMQEGKV